MPKVSPEQIALDNASALVADLSNVTVRLDPRNRGEPMTALEFEAYTHNGTAGGTISQRVTVSQGKQVVEWTFSRDTYEQRTVSSDPDSPVGKLGVHVAGILAQRLHTADALAVTEALVRRLEIPGTTVAIEMPPEGTVVRGRDTGYLVRLGAGALVITSVSAHSWMYQTKWTATLLDNEDGVRALAESVDPQSPIARAAELLAERNRGDTAQMAERMTTELTGGI